MEARLAHLRLARRPLLVDLKRQVEFVLKLVPAVERLPDLAPFPFAVHPPFGLGMSDEQNVHIEAASPCDKSAHEGNRGLSARAEGVLVAESLRLLGDGGVEEFADRIHHNRLEAVRGGRESGKLLNDRLEV